MDDLEGLVIYKQYVELIYYTLSILLKYPKSERFSLAQDIKNSTYDGLKDIIYAQKEYDKKKRLSYLNELDANLKIIKVLIRVSHKKKYINSKREARSQKFSVWSKYLLYITLAMILLRFICILIPSGELKTRGSALPVYLSIIMMALFVMINSQVIWFLHFIQLTAKDLTLFIIKRLRSLLSIWL